MALERGAVSIETYRNYFRMLVLHTQIPMTALLFLWGISSFAGARVQRHQVCRPCPEGIPGAPKVIAAAEVIAQPAKHLCRCPSGWWFEPLWKIWVNWDDYKPNINGKMPKMATSHHQPVPGFNHPQNGWKTVNKIDQSQAFEGKMIKVCHYLKGTPGFGTHFETRFC